MYIYHIKIINIYFLIINYLPKKQRYYYYITNGIDTYNVADMDNEWLLHVLDYIPMKYKLNCKEKLIELANEMRKDYNMSIKRAIGILFDIFFIFNTHYIFKLSN